MPRATLQISKWVFQDMEAIPKIGFAEWPGTSRMHDVRHPSKLLIHFEQQIIGACNGSAGEKKPVAREDAGVAGESGGESERLVPNTESLDVFTRTDLLRRLISIVSPSSLGDQKSKTT
ncbi:hypothetical protein OIDMADRAFT_16490 [Oidiodendron maius Zn]|uniref:Uncharacterized protein n=1 Tax=Oidiodendron maius (strain Zn) TaxID=913774 RepID=A0A0C3D9X3_OIDMZ|nr:hypothetical protein OIDMADRAFT_16490 [Oidiodendron maius Zn]